MTVFYFAHVQLVACLALTYPSGSNAIPNLRDLEEEKINVEKRNPSLVGWADTVGFLISTWFPRSLAGRRWCERLVALNTKRKNGERKSFGQNFQMSTEICGVVVSALVSMDLMIRENTQQQYLPVSTRLVRL